MSKKCEKKEISNDSLAQYRRNTCGRQVEKYAGLAEELVKTLGGNENIKDVYHCQTRLRFLLADESRVDDQAVGAIDGVVKAIRNAGVYQVVIGTHVADVFEEVEKLVTIKKGKGAENKEKIKVFESVIAFVAGVFQPVIPALSGAGMVKALLALLVVMKVVNSENQTYVLLNTFADGVFYFLPMLLAYTTAQKLKCNPILAAGVAAMMLHPNWSAMVAAGEPVMFFDVIPFTLTNYANSVIPIILIIFVQAYVEKLLKKWIPKAVELVFVPMLTFLIMGVLAFSLLGPIGAVLGGYLATFFTFLSETAAWAPAVLVGGLLPVMVMFGLHNGVAPLGVMQMANLGYDSIFGPGCLCSNMAQATAGAVVAFRTRSKKTKQLAASGAITAYMGITEPILYGVALPKKYPLVSSMIGGACGGLYAGLTHTHRFSTGSSGLPAILLYLGNDTTKYLVNIIIAIIISIAVTAVATFFLSLKFETDAREETVEGDREKAYKEMEEKAKKKEEEKEEKKEEKKDAEGNQAPEEYSFASPVKGRVLPLKEAKDEAFSSGALGMGVVILPKEGRVVAPFDATVEALFPTNHAICLSNRYGVELMIHVGIDTVTLDGRCFKACVRQGDCVKTGDVLVEFDIDGIRKAGCSEQTIVIVTNSEDYSSVDVKENIETDGKEMVIQIKR